MRDAARGLLRPLAGRSYGRPLLRRTAAIEHLVIVPPDLRAVDPGFLDEVRDGQFGVDGFVVEIGDGGPFDVTDAPAAWHAALHGFGWLRHLDASGTVDAETFARDTIDAWLAAAHTDTDVHAAACRNAPGVLARRVLSWLAHAGLILDAANRTRYDAVMGALARDIRRLDRSWRKTDSGEARLTAAIARVQARLSTGATDARRQRAERDLARELETQILADGGHISRNADVLVRLMFDLLPLRQCYQARQIVVPVPLFSAMSRIVPYLRFMRLGDGSLARFNGGGHASADALATIVGYDAPRHAAPVSAAASGYVRLTAKATVVIADVGPPPPPAHAFEAHAGCLSFEMSDVGARLFSHPRRTSAAADVRDTHWHSTVSLDGASSAMLPTGGAALVMPGAVHALAAADDGRSAAAVHAGFADKFGVDHTRRLTLSDDGTSLDGVDLLVPVKGMPPTRCLFAVHFHIDRAVAVRRGEQAGTVVLTPPGGAPWHFVADAALLAIEAGAQSGLQIVLRGACDTASGPLAITWAIKRQS